jgi:hypothetical protein
MICNRCNEEKELKDFPKELKYCKLCFNKKQRERRKENNNKITLKYEKTKQGFLMRLYRNMLSRITGVQKKKHHLYQNKSLLEKIDFYNWAINNIDFHILFQNWENNNYDRKLTPSVDRIDSDKGYSLDNIEWVTHSENSRRGAISKKRKYENLAHK